MTRLSTDDQFPELIRTDPVDVFNGISEQQTEHGWVAFSEHADKLPQTVDASLVVVTLELMLLKSVLKMCLLAVNVLFVRTQSNSIDRRFNNCSNVIVVRLRCVNTVQSASGKYQVSRLA